MFGISYVELLLVLGIGSVILGNIRAHANSIMLRMLAAHQPHFCVLQGRKTFQELLEQLGKPQAEQQHT